MFDIPSRHKCSLILDTRGSDVAVDDNVTSRSNGSRGPDHLLEHQQIGSALDRWDKAPNPKSLLSKDGSPVGKDRQASGKSCLITFLMSSRILWFFLLFV